jgi:heptosyltransferase-2
MKVLIIGLNWLGDIVMSLPTIAAVARKYETHVLTRPHLAEVYQLSGIKLHLHSINTKESFFSLFKQTAPLRTLKLHCAICLPSSMRAAILAKMCGAQRCIGYKAQFREIFLDHSLALPTNYKEIHESKLYAALLHEIGIAEVHYGFQPKPFEPSFRSNLLGKCAIKPDQPYCVIAPGAAFGAAKRWPTQHFADFIALLKENEPHMQVVLTAGAKEATIVEEIEAKFNGELINTIGKTTVTELGCLLSGASLLVANDSGTMHLGALYKIPTVVPVGPTDMQRTGALNTKFKPIIAQNCPKIPCRKRECPLKTHQCMQSITPEAIYQASKSLRT